MLKNIFFVPSKEDKDIFRIFKKKKYYKIRTGEIKPIPVDDMHGFDVWGGDKKSVYLSKRDLDNSALQKDRYIPRKKKKRK